MRSPLHEEVCPENGCLAIRFVDKPTGVTDSASRYFRHALAGSDSPTSGISPGEGSLLGSASSAAGTGPKSNVGSAALTAAGNPIATPDAVLFDPTKVRIERYWYRGTKILSPYDPILAA
jgi:hypothetical protein